MNFPPAASRHLQQPERGSLLIVAMILCAVIGVSIVSYLNLSRTGMEISNRALYNNGAMNLAENGLEQAVFAVNKSVMSTYDWTAGGWTTTGGGDDVQQKWTDYDFGNGTRGMVRAYIYDYAGGAAPKIVTRSTVTVGGGSSQTIEKWIEVQLRRTSRFSNGLVARNAVSFSGNNASVDSWNSDPDNDGAGLIPYSAAVKNDNGSVGSISVSVSAISVNNADIWGYASTGGALPEVGANGLVGPFGTSTGTMDMGHVSTDFTASFDDVTAPTTGTAIAAITSLTPPITIGSPGATTEVRLPNIWSAGNSTNVLTIQGDVIMVLTAPAGSTAISLTGNASISIAPGASLTIYTEGNIDIGGNGVANGGTTAATANRPINFQIYGTRTTTGQTVAVAGNGAFSGVVYAPNANVTVNGNGDVMGSVVGNNVTLTGNAAFHYDESLANMDSGNPYRVSKWKELTSATDRSAYSSVLSF